MSVGNRARDHPENDRLLFVIEPNDNGTVDVCLLLSVANYPTETGMEHDARASVVQGVVPWPGMIDDIRKRFDDWCASGEIIDL